MKHKVDAINNLLNIVEEMDIKDNLDKQLKICAIFIEMHNRIRLFSFRILVKITT